MSWAPGVSIIASSPAPRRESRFGDFRASEAEVLPAGSAQLAIVPPFLRLSAELVASLLATERLHQFGLVDCWLAVRLACTCGQHLTISQAPLVS